MITMTNEEWVKSLKAEELCKFIAAPSVCSYCAYRNNIERCMNVVCCEDGVLEWLEQEHKNDDNRRKGAKIRKSKRLQSDSKS